MCEKSKRKAINRNGAIFIVSATDQFRINCYLLMLSAFCFLCVFGVHIHIFLIQTTSDLIKVQIKQWKIKRNKFPSYGFRFTGIASWICFQSKVVEDESLEQSNGFYIILSTNTKSSEMFTSTFRSGRKLLRNMSSF